MDMQGILKRINTKSNDIDKYTTLTIEVNNANLGELDKLMLKALTITIKEDNIY